MDCRGGFSLDNAVIKDCRLTEEHGVAAIIETDSCIRSSSAKRKMRLSNALFESNTNRGGSAGLVVREASCHSEVELLNVSFEGNEYLRASVLANDNTLTNVRVIANRKTASNDRKTSFFHFPVSFSSIVTNMTAKDNANAHVLYVERGKLNVSWSLYQNNAGSRSAVVKVLSTSLTMHETRFLDNRCNTSYVAVAAKKASSIHFSFCTFARNVGGENSGGIVLATAPRATSFISCDFIENVANGSAGSTVVLKGSGTPVNGGRRQTASANFIRCKFLSNKCLNTTAVHILKLYSQTFLFDSCEVRNNTKPHRLHSMVSVFGEAAIKVEDSFVQNFTMKNCTLQSNSDLHNVLLFSSAYGTFLIQNTSFSDNRIPGILGLRTGVLSVQREFVSRPPSFAQTTVDKEAAARKEEDSEYTLTVEDSDFAGNGRLSDFTGDERLLTGSAFLISDELLRIELRNSFFRDNQGNKGAAVLVETAYSLVVDSCTFVQNKAAYRGGAMRIESKAPDFLVIQRSTFVKNVGQYGGAIDASRAITVQDAQFRENRAEIRGGAVDIQYPKKVRSCRSCVFHVQRSTFTENQAARSGGAIHADARTSLETTMCSFRRNNATFGGGVSFFYDGQLYHQGKIVKDSKFTQNDAEIGGEAQDFLGKL